MSNARALRIWPGDRMFEVGCGAGVEDQQIRDYANAAYGFNAFGLRS